MEKINEKEAEDIASGWVRNLRSRFMKLGLSYASESEISNNSAAVVSSKVVKPTKKMPANDYGNYITRVYENNSDISFEHGSTSPSVPEKPLADSNVPLGNGFENPNQKRSEVVAMASARSTGSTLPDLERLRKKRMMYFQRGSDNGVQERSLLNEHSRASEKHDNKATPNHSSLSDKQNTYNFTEMRDKFYSRRRRSSSTDSWEKHAWDCRFNEVESPEVDDELAQRFKSNEDNVELMLDWWGLNDLSSNPEICRYIPRSRKKRVTSQIVTMDSENEEGGGSADWREKAADVVSKDDLVFPIEFDQGDYEIAQIGKSNQLLDQSADLHSASDGDSDYTQDDPVLKHRTLRPCISPRNSSSHSVLSQSTPPPVPQIKGSLYHEFSHSICPEKAQVPDACAIVGDELVDYQVVPRPRSMSQPSITSDSYDKYGDIFSPFEEDNSSVEVFCNLSRKTKGKSLNFSSRRSSFDDTGEVIGSMKETKPESRDLEDNFVSTVFVNVSVGCGGNEKPVLDKCPEKYSEMVSVCPGCNEINNTEANWCIECGFALVGIKSDKSMFTKQKQGESTASHVGSNIISQISNPQKLQEKSSAIFNSTEGNQKTIQEYQQVGRRWEKSSIAWNTYKDSHLSKPSTVKNFRNRSKNKFVSSEQNGNSFGRPSSASCKNSVKRRDGNFYSQSNSSVAGSWPKSHKVKEFKSKKRNAWESATCPSSSELNVKGNKPVNRTPSKTTKNEFSLDLSGLNDYAEITQMIRSNRGKPLPFLCLPDEVILRIFIHLSHTDLARCSQVCQQFNRICQDECLWKIIVLEKKQNMCDEFLEKIGSKKPISLSLIKCRGNQVTSIGLRELFRRCSENLEELNFSGCNGGQLIGESILLHVALRCSQLRSVDASWSNVGDNGVEALVENVDRLECLCLNGCQAITDHSLKVIADKHGESLKTIEIFGCFNVSAPGIKRLGQKCPNLETLNLGQCYKITSASLGQLVSHLQSIVNLDLRGCKQARDACVKTIAKHCPHLVNLVLANCPLITDISMAEIATNLPCVRCLDVCGCVKVTDHGVRALARSCNRLNYLDLSSTGITQKSVMLLANYCSQNLESLKLSFCVDVTDDSVSRLVKHCKRMTTLHLYGCKRLRNVKALQKLNRSLKLEF